MAHQFDNIPTSGKFQENGTGPLKWAELEETAFDRIITSVHDFSLFMRDLFVPEGNILVPPESGWDEIDEEVFAGLRKSPLVIKTLKHMTYIKAFSTGDAYECFPGQGGLVDWRKPRLIKQLGITPGTGKSDGYEAVRITTETIEPAPADVIGLVRGGRDYPVVLLDCRYGIIQWNDTTDGKTDFGRWATQPHHQHHDGIDSSWRQETAWPVEEFFVYLKDKFVSMKQLPREYYEIESDFYFASSKPEMDELREIFTRHGWPQDYNKLACISELEDRRRKRLARLWGR